jgi:hypothetical protein
VTKLIAEDHVSPNNIVVLIVDAKRREVFFNQIGELTLPKPTRFSCDSRKTESDLLVTTVKGLEADVVFLWGYEGLPTADIRELMYVGISRAKSMLYYVGSDNV